MISCGTATGHMYRHCGRGFLQSPARLWRRRFGHDMEKARALITSLEAERVAGEFCHYKLMDRADNVLVNFLVVVIGSFHLQKHSKGIIKFKGRSAFIAMVIMIFYNMYKQNDIICDVFFAM